MRHQITRNDQKSAFKLKIFFKDFTVFFKLYKNRKTQKKTKFFKNNFFFFSGVVPDDTFTVSQAINSIGFGRFQILLSLAVGLCWMADREE